MMDFSSNATKLLGALALGVILLVIVPLFIAATGRNDLYYTLTLISLLSVASAGVWITFYIGRINIGQAAYALIGGYVSAILVVDYGWSFWLTIPAAGIFSAFIAILIGLPILRLRGVYFAMVTLVSTEVARLAALALPITNGARGMSNLPPPGPIAIGPLTIIPDFATLADPHLAFYLLSVITMLVVFGLVYRLVHSRIGKLFVALQQNEELASSMGVNIAWLRIIAYASSSFLGGVAGAIFSAISQSVYPNSFTTQDSINFMLNCFLGGLGYVFGPMVGTFILRFGWDLLFQTERYQLLIYAIGLIALMLLLPNGIMSVLGMRRSSKAAR
jgi:branched-chain amino acid transport system permease protein